MIARQNTMQVHVEFGDCDPAQIVYYPNFLRWMDAATWQFFEAAGVPPWHQIPDAPGLIGIPLVDVQASFRSSATYGDTLDIHTTISEWRARSFVLSHLIERDGKTLVEGREIRVFACRDGSQRTRIRAVEPPPSIRMLIETA